MTTLNEQIDKEINAMIHSKVRALPVCIACCGPKDDGLLLCWSCHKQQKRLQHPGGDYEPNIVAAFDLIEAGEIIVDARGRMRAA